LFVNRLLKVLDADLTRLENGAKQAKELSQFLFPTRNVFGPNVSIFGKKAPAASFFYSFLGPLDAPGKIQAIKGYTDEPLDKFECQFFDFGILENDTIMDESITVYEGFAVDLIRPPASICWMEHSWTDDLGNRIPTGYIYITDKLGVVGAEIRCLNSRSLAATLLATFGVGLYETDIKYDEYFIWDGTVLRMPWGSGPKDAHNVDVLAHVLPESLKPANIFDPLMAMLGRLEADGVSKTHCPAPIKLNRRREKKGLPGLVSYTEVKIRDSRVALGHSGALQTPAANKRYHFRRGHVRHFQNGERTWVRPCFVGDPSDGITKHTYKVNK